MSNPVEVEAFVDFTNTHTDEPARTTTVGNMTVVIPPASDDDISDGLRDLTKALMDTTVVDSGVGGLLGGEYGYGAAYENDTFGLRPYCWCDEDDCVWCACCTCPDEAIVYTVNGAVATWDEYFAARNNPDAVRDAVLQREHACRWCAGEPGLVAAPHFWHKPTGSWVRWYKWIGRDNVSHINGTWADILAGCLASITTKPGEFTLTPVAPTGLGTPARDWTV